MVISSILPDSDDESLYSVLLTAVPFITSAGAQLLTSSHSQRVNERRYHLAALWAFAVVCLALLPLAQMKSSAAGSFVLLTLGVVGVFGVEGISFSYYLALMGGEKGLGISVMNSLGALGGFVGPYVIGSLAQATGQYYSSMWMMGACLLVATVSALLVSEEWAAKFSFHSGLGAAVSRQSSARSPDSLGWLPSLITADSSMLAAAAGYMVSDNDSDVESTKGDVADKL